MKKLFLLILAFYLSTGNYAVFSQTRSFEEKKQTNQSLIDPAEKQTIKQPIDVPKKKNVEEPMDRPNEQSVWQLNVSSIEQDLIVPDDFEENVSKEPIITPPGADKAAEAVTKPINKQLEGTGLIFLPGSSRGATPKEVIKKIK